MIDVICRTFLDDYKKHLWPVKMWSVPLIGHWVESLDGTCRLKVCGIGHRMRKGLPDKRGIVPYTPIIEVELTR
jgi:hypothetical protein